MAKGDDSRARNQINQQGGLAQNNLNNLRTDTVVPQNQTMWNNYQNAVAQDVPRYNQQFEGYENYLREQPYQGFINNGGINPDEASSIRARAISPTRAIYQNAKNDVARNSRLNPNSAINSNAAMSRLSRESSSAISDADTNAEAQLAGLRQQGREFGTTGEVNRQLGARAGMTSLYGTTPGQTRTFGDQVLQSTDNQLKLAQLQNQLGLGIINGQNDASKIPGKMDTTLGWVNSIANDVKALNPYSGGK